jgi:hypothetical protein
MNGVKKENYNLHKEFAGDIMVFATFNNITDNEVKGLMETWIDSRFNAKLREADSLLKGQITETETIEDD